MRRDKISSRLEKLCHSQQLHVVTKSRLNSRQIYNLCCDKEFFFFSHDLAEENCEEDFSVATLLKKSVKKTVAILFTLL